MAKSKENRRKRYAAIDTGSNAVRLLIKELEWTTGGRFNEEVVAYYRVPLRLGSMVFNSGQLSAQGIQNLIQVMHAFKLLMNVQGVARFRACATSAIRTAENRSCLLYTSPSPRDLH